MWPVSQRPKFKNSLINKNNMKNFSNTHREKGVALITAIVISVALAMLLSASLVVAMTNTRLGWDQVEKSASLQTADAGINNELQYIAINAGSSILSSQPIVYNGVTTRLPNGNLVKGRPGLVPGYNQGEFYVCSSNDAASTIPWDGTTSPFYITSTGIVGGEYQIVQVTSTAKSIFNNGGSTTNNPGNGVTVNPSPQCQNTTPCSDVEISGSFGTNGNVNCSKNCNIHADSCVNWNSNNANNQFNNNNVTNGGQLLSNSQPLVMPKTVDACSACFGFNRTNSQPGCSGDSHDSNIFNNCKNNCKNSSGIYQYNNNARASNISPQNCTKFNYLGYQLNNDCFGYANIKPGTGWWWGNNNNNSCAVNTLIFEPGDYYFTDINLLYDASCELIIDSGALASNGTPGQVRFWIYSNDGNSDCIQIPITNTLAPGETTIDPGKFRIYYAKDGCTLSFTRPNNISDCNGNEITGDFDYYCGLYSCTKPCGDNTCSVGTTVSINGTCQQKANPGTGCCNFHGCMVCDKLVCSGACNINFTQSRNCGKDLCNNGTILSWSCGG